METQWGLFWITALGFLIHARGKRPSGSQRDVWVGVPAGCFKICVCEGARGRALLSRPRSDGWQGTGTTARRVAAETESRNVGCGLMSPRPLEAKAVFWFGGGCVCRLCHGRCLQDPLSRMEYMLGFLNFLGLIEHVGADGFRGAKKKKLKKKKRPLKHSLVLRQTASPETGCASKAVCSHM